MRRTHSQQLKWVCLNTEGSEKLWNLSENPLKETLVSSFMSPGGHNQKQWLENSNFYFCIHNKDCPIIKRNYLEMAACWIWPILTEQNSFICEKNNFTLFKYILFTKLLYLNKTSHFIAIWELLKCTY